MAATLAPWETDTTAEKPPWESSASADTPPWEAKPATTVAPTATMPPDMLGEIQAKMDAPKRIVPEAAGISAVSGAPMGQGGIEQGVRTTPTGENIAEAWNAVNSTLIPEGVSKGVIESAIPGVKLAEQIPGTTGKRVTGAVEGAANVADALVTPANVLLMTGLAGTPALVSKLVGLGFSAQMAHGAYEQSKQLANESDPQKQAQLATEILLNSAGAIAGALHAVPHRAELVTPELRAKEQADIDDFVAQRKVAAQAEAAGAPLTAQALRDAPTLETPITGTAGAPTLSPAQAEPPTDILGTGQQPAGGTPKAEPAKAETLPIGSVVNSQVYKSEGVPLTITGIEPSREGRPVYKAVVNGREMTLDSKHISEIVSRPEQSSPAPAETKMAGDLSRVKNLADYLNGRDLIDKSKPEKAIAAATVSQNGDVGIGLHHGEAAETGLGRPIEATDKREWLTSHGRIVADKSAYTPEIAETATQTDAPPIRETPIEKLTLSKDVPQFKRGANEKGVVEPIGGKYTRAGTPPIAVWERLDGSLEVITGRHKFDLAQRGGETTVPTQIYREADGFTARDAARLDAETNIRDGQGKVADYASYFKDSKLSEADAKQRGLLARGVGKAGFSIARDGSEDTFALHQSGRLTDSQAEKIASAAPNNEGAQQVGIKAALEGKSSEYAANLIKAAMARSSPSAKTGDLFSFDDAAMREMDAQAKLASAIQSELSKTKAAITGASKDPARAKAEGVDVKDPEAVRAKVDKINAELERWSNWPMHSDLIARTRGKEVAPKGKTIAKDVAPLISGEQTKTPEQLTSEAADDEAAKIEMQKKQDVRTGWSKPKQAADLTIQQDLLSGAPESDVPLFDQPKAAHDWTSATEESTPQQPSKGMKFGGKESGAINLPRFADRKMSDLDKATAGHSAKLQKSFDEATRAQKEIKKAIPSVRRQNAVSVWMEADGDAAILAKWEAGAKGKMFKEAARLAQTLTPEEIAIARKAQTAFGVLAKRGARYDVLNSGRDNYVPHVWEVKKGTGFGSGKLQQNFKFAKARTFADFSEGDAADFTPKTLAIGKLLPAYLHEMNKVIADRQFVQDISSGKARDQRPLVVPRGRVSTIEPATDEKVYLANPDAYKGIKDASGNPIEQGDYKTFSDQPALHDWRWENKDTEGNPIFMRDDLALHPDAARRVNAMMGKSALRQYYNEPSEGVSQVPRALLKAYDKSQAVMKREMFGFLAPFHQVQEGWHGIAHRVNPFFGIPKVDLRVPAQMDAAKHGLMLLPDRASSQSYMEGLGGRGTFLTQAARALGEKADGKLMGKAATGLADVVDGYQNYLFHQYIPGLKFKTYEAIRGRNMDLYDSELKAGKLTEADVKLMSAEQTNAAYGHLNMALLDQDPTIQHIKQLVLLAPDFLEARSRFVGQAFKGLTGSKVGIEQFKAIATIALVQAGIAYVTTKLGGDKYDATHPFEAVHGDRKYTLRSVPEDLWSLGGDVANLIKGGDKGTPFISARVNPMFSSLEQLRTGLNYRGEKTTALDTMEELFAKYIPITARSIPGVRSLTETSRHNPVSPLEQLAGSLGLKVSRKSPITDTHALASQWMDAQKIDRDKGSYPVSKFQQLRYALEDGDLSTAGKEWDKLKKYSAPDKLVKGFHESVDRPFTKSKDMDAKFRASLNQSDKAVFDLAKAKREQILSRFHLIRTVPQKQPAASKGGRW